MLKIRTGRAGLCFVALIALASSTLVGAARADDLHSALDRIDRLERDLNQLQRQVYRNQVGTAPTPAGGAGEGAPLDTQIRMDQIDNQLRALTGQLEEIEYNIDKLAKRLEKAQADDDVRFRELEGHGQVASAAPSAPVPIAPPPGRPNPGAGDMERPASTTGALAIPAPVPTAPPPGAQVAKAETSAPLPNGSAMDEYNYAFGLLRVQDFKGAESAFKIFLEKHPSDQLAGNAQYWLGETYFVRNDFPAAAGAFAEGYRKYPQGPKAADDLLKLGMALGNSGRKQEACFSFAKLERDFPQMVPVVKDREVSEKKRIGC
jgi:tol-pal system protein YbgF